VSLNQTKKSAWMEGPVPEAQAQSKKMMSVLGRNGVMAESSCNKPPEMFDDATEKAVTRGLCRGGGRPLILGGLGIGEKSQRGFKKNFSFRA